MNASSRPVLSPIGVAARPPRGNLAVIAIGSLAVVVAVLGWRWAHRPRPVIAAAAAAPVAAAMPVAAPSTASLEVTVLEVKSLPPPAPAVAPPVVAVPVVEPPPTPPPPSPANRTLVRNKKPTHPTAGRSETAEARPVEHEHEHVEPAPPPATKPDPQKPAIEANPYLYK